MTSVTVLLLLVVVLRTFWPQGAIPRLDGRASLAVLPFISNPGDGVLLAQGLAEDIIVDLSRHRGMDVIAHNSTKDYAGSAIDIREIGRALKVGYVLEGAVQRNGDRIGISAKLTDASEGVHLWSERWDRPAEDYFAVQSEIAAELGHRLGATAVLGEAAPMHRARVANLPAYELYLSSRSEKSKFTEQGFRTAIKLLEAAIAADSDLAPAWSELSDAHQALINFGEAPATVLPTALAAARRAIEIDPSDAFAHAALGRALELLGDLVPSEVEFEAALRLGPGDARVLAQYARSAKSFGRPDRAADAADRAIRLDPNYPSWQANAFSHAYFSAGRYGDVLHVLEHLPEDQFDSHSWVLRAASYAAIGEREKAKRAVGNALGRYPALTIEGVIGSSAWSEAERQRLEETMQAAGFPACGKRATSEEDVSPRPLTDCNAE